MKTMNKILLAFSFYLGGLLAVTVEPFYRHSTISPHAASEVFYTGSERQILAPAPVVETSGPVEAQAAPVPAIVSAPSLAFPAPAAPFEAPVTPVAAPVPVAFTAPIAAKVVQFKLSYPQYAYGYSVQDFTTGDNKAAKEVREGGKVKGSYSVADPDGTKRTVNYYADPIHGFNAVVHKTQIL